MSLPQQPPCEDRFVMSQQLAMLSMIHDLEPPHVFQAHFSEFVREFKLQAVLHGVKGADLRHIAKADGRQRFIVIFEGKIWDHFDFSATEAVFPGDEFEPQSDSGDIGFQPFDLPNLKP